MRRGAIVFAVCCITTLLFLLHSVRTLLTLFVDDGLRDAILVDELTAPGTQLIPKIIHQTYKNISIPEVWQEAHQSCLALHSDWEYKFWTDESSEQFIADEYPWFLDTFQNYDYDIQRADAIRYFALAHYGGIYIDLDDGCNQSLEPLLQYPAWVRKTTPTGISNDVMGAVKGHPFFVRATEDLQRYSYISWGPYITVMATTGPLFLSLIWRHWSGEGLNVDAGRVRILLKDEYMGQPTSFFIHHIGNSWHQADVHFITWLHEHWILVTLIAISASFGLLACAWRLCDHCLLPEVEAGRRTRRRSPSSLLPSWLRSNPHLYEKIEDHDHDV